MMHTHRNLRLKNCFNIFQPVDSCFLICKLTILIDFSLYILRIKIAESSPWQCLVLYLNSSQKRAKKHKLYLIFDTKTNKLKSSFI